MNKLVGKSVVIVFAGVMLIVGIRFSAAQERPMRGPGMGGPGMREGPDGAGLLFAFDRIDKNSDGKITKDEATDWLWERIVRADTDSDGALTRQELETMRPPGREGAPQRGAGFGPGRADRGRPGEGRAGRGGPGEGGPGRGRAGAVSFESSPLPKNEAEKKILDVLDDMNRNQRRGMMNVPQDDGRLLRLLAESVGAKHVVEIGTSNGYSGIWFCLALRKTGGKLTTYEIDARRASLARENFKRAGVDSLVTLVEGDAHEEVQKMEQSIDVLFLDADKEGYIDYLNKLLPKVRPGGLVVAHNINQRQADPRYVKAITTNADLETLFLPGIGVSMKKH